MDYRKNDLLDDAYERNRESFALTLNSEPETGKEVYQYYIGVLYKELKGDVKDIKQIDRKYRKFKIKERKHQIRLEKLGFGKFVKSKGFVEISPEDADEDLSTKKKRKRFNKRCRKYYKENRRFIKVIRKYRIYLPEDLYVEPEEPINATQENEVQGASNESINAENVVPGSSAGDTPLSASDDGAEAPATEQEEKAEEENGETLVEDEGCEVEEEQMDEKLGAFFDEDEDCGENEEVNEENLDLQKTG